MRRPLVVGCDVFQYLQFNLGGPLRSDEEVQLDYPLVADREGAD
jgi:hypothetical protein